MSDYQCDQQGLAASLPTELLVSILRGSLPPMVDRNGRREFQKLRMICSRWRTICLSTPLFWSSLRLEAPLFNTSETIPSTSLLKSWFSRAGSLVPLSLSFDDSRGRTIDESNDDFIMFIQAHQERWIYLYLDLHMDVLFRLLKICPVTLWTNLHYFGMSEGLVDDRDFESIAQAVTEKTLLVNQFPAVKELTLLTWLGTLEMICIGAHNTVEKMTWYSEGMLPGYLAPLLSRYQLLTHLDIRCVEDANQEPLPPIILHSLKSFSFTATACMTNWEFLGMFRTPLLSELVLTFDQATNVHRSESETSQGRPIRRYEGLTAIPRCIQPLLESCKTGTLSSFSLNGTIPPRGIRWILPLVPDGITTLTLPCWPYHSVLPSLEQPLRGSKMRFFPKLESLRFSDTPGRYLERINVNIYVEALVLFLSQRMEETVEHVRLRSLEVTRDEYFPNEEVERLKERGFNVVVWAQSPF
ncbi:hypothetical protein BKA70DRAFT_1343607 [Coprinopsis sp. MPI-PUGE-AT-0042]|nr:hypothetical protein BKA70DRAFT_1343607 [Coprinopsis sp. MPI-PUGE-AT-0042]